MTYRLAVQCTRQIYRLSDRLNLPPRKAPKHESATVQMAPGIKKVLDQEPTIQNMATGADMATAIAQRARGTIHEKNPASSAKGNETAANAAMVLLAASPTPMRMAIPNRPMNKARMVNTIPAAIPVLPCMVPSLLGGFHGQMTAADPCRRRSGGPGVGCFFFKPVCRSKQMPHILLASQYCIAGTIN